MRKFIRASVLVVALAVPAFAGDIPNNLTGKITDGATAACDIQHGVAGETPNNVAGEIPFGVTSRTLFDALLSLLSLI